MLRQRADSSAASWAALHLLRPYPYPLEIAKDLSSLFVGDAAVRLKPIPGALFCKFEFFKPPNQWFTRYAEGVRRAE